MHRLNRIIAALMLVVFIPVAVMAGPMRVCVSMSFTRRPSKRSRKNVIASSMRRSAV